ncbi:MAG: MBOAT family protein [Deltaproteobacteria bacterium]|nr:MBOAT family protein [Deltaproteobacteria bacterium]
MVFSSILFLTLFLPVTLLVYYLVGRWFRNITLLIASLFFYAWGEGAYVLLMLASIAINYFIGLQLTAQTDPGRRKIIITAGVTVNLIGLIAFKYTNWLVETLADILPGISSSQILEEQIHLPIGISFFTFQAISYIIDVYRKESKSQRNFFHLGLYIASFPQLIAGPIVRYHDVARQIAGRVHSFPLFASGVERFILGLSKKVLIANPMASMADRIFAFDYLHLSPGIAWLGISCYTLQIYFDFSGYSDMAIGLGRMFGFRFLENFNYPYISKSIQEFWRRWHISLSRWFRDYLYIPLGGNRKGTKRTYANLFIVFLLCGLWHGASWNFVLWGVIHGTFLILERKFLKMWLDASHRIICHCYTLLVVTHAWVFFRVEDFSDARDYLAAMYGMADKVQTGPMIYTAIDTLFITSLAAGVLFSMPVVGSLQERFETVWAEGGTATIIRSAALLSLLLISFSFLAVNSYNPFIYFRF